METGDEAVDGQILGNLVFAVDDLQYQFPLRLVQLFNEFLMATLNFNLELRCGKFFVETIVYGTDEIQRTFGDTLLSVILLYTAH